LAPDVAVIDDDGRRSWRSRAEVVLDDEERESFVWHKSADRILDSLASYCRRINDSGHEAAARTKQRRPGRAA
jgi:hypothetical protein